MATVPGTITLQESPAWGRGVLASYEHVTPQRTDASKFTLTLRDVLLLIGGCLGMFAAQLGAQYGLRSDIRDLKTSFESYQQKQGEMNAALQRQLNETSTALQRQIDDARRQANLAIVNDAGTAKELSELKGFLAGAGIKRPK